MTANRVAPWLDDGDLQLYHGAALTVLQGLPAGIAQPCVTSPPYWGLRDYGTGQWTGGDEACDHTPRSSGGPSMLQGASQRGRSDVGACRCGAQRVDSQLGLEATPTEYVENMVALFREVRRVLRDDGTLWLNLGDSYAGSPNWMGNGGVEGGANDGSPPPRAQLGGAGLKPKDLVGIPWRVAFALQADGWYLRSDIIWSKPNPMPESVSDRPTKAHEYLFLFSKQAKYMYDADAIREPHVPDQNGRQPRGEGRGFSELDAPQERVRGSFSGNIEGREYNPAGRNRRSVWTIPTQPFPEAHFATYPQELVRPCILAGTSEKGECVECGAAWIRQTEVDYADAPGGSPMANHTNTKGADEFGVRVNQRALKTVDTTGWAPSCSCDAATRPQLVLDPFCGSGTTNLVARKHGRRSLGIDLSAEYLAIAAKRTQQLSLLGGVA